MNRGCSTGSHAALHASSQEKTTVQTRLSNGSHKVAISGQIVTSHAHRTATQRVVSTAAKNKLITDMLNITTLWRTRRDTRELRTFISRGSSLHCLFYHFRHFIRLYDSVHTTSETSPQNSDQFVTPHIRCFGRAVDRSALTPPEQMLQRFPRTGTPSYTPMPVDVN